MAITAEDQTRALIESSNRDADARSIVMRNVLWASGVGLITVPWIDIAGVTVVNLKMISELADRYNIPFIESAGKSAITSLIAGLGHRTLALGVVGSTLKAIPGLGTIFGSLSVPIFAGALTYAVGRIFTMHFESNGTLLTFNPTKFREQFKQEFEGAKPLVANAIKEGEATPA